jgi:hypothetical protein
MSQRTPGADEPQWPPMRPMASAPRDGANILAYHRDSFGSGFCFASYDDGSWAVTINDGSGLSIVPEAELLAGGPCQR